MTTNQDVNKFEPRTIPYKTYNITGKKVKVRLNDAPDPFLWKDVWLPAKVLTEYPKFLLVEILPHINPNESLGMSRPYTLGLNKMSIHFGSIDIKMDEEENKND